MLLGYSERYKAPSLSILAMDREGGDNFIVTEIDLLKGFWEIDGTRAKRNGRRSSRT